MRPGILAFFAFGALIVGAGSAQGPVKLRGNGGAAPGSIGWLTMPSVREELKLKPEQAEKAKGLARDLQGKWEESRKALADLPRQERSTKLTALADAQYEEGMKALGTFLEPEQVDRFDQILFQRRGARAMLEPRMVETLKLTPAQKKELNSIIIQSLNEHNKIMQAIRNDPVAMEVKLQGNLKEYHLRAVEKLDADQKKAWEQVSGPPFEKPIGEQVTP